MAEEPKPSEEPAQTTAPPRSPTKSSTLRASLKVEPDQVRGAFEKFADSEEGCLKVENLTDVLGELGLGEAATPKELAIYVKTVSANPMQLTCEET